MNNTNKRTPDLSQASPRQPKGSSELDRQIQEILWSYGYPFDEKIKSDNYNEKIYRKRKLKSTKEMKQLLSAKLSELLEKKKPLLDGYKVADFVPISAIEQMLKELE